MGCERVGLRTNRINSNFLAYHVLYINCCDLCINCAITVWSNWSVLIQHFNKVLARICVFSVRCSAILCRASTWWINLESACEIFKKNLESSANMIENVWIKWSYQLFIQAMAPYYDSILYMYRVPLQHYILVKLDKVKETVLIK